MPFPYSLGNETVVNELRRGYPGDENERRTLRLLHVATREVEMLPLEAPGARVHQRLPWSPDGRLLIDRVSDTGIERWVYVSIAAPAPAAPVWQDRRDSRIYPSYAAQWQPTASALSSLPTPPSGTTLRA